MSEKALVMETKMTEMYVFVLLKYILQVLQYVLLLLNLINHFESSMIKYIH